MLAHSTFVGRFSCSLGVMNVCTSITRCMPRNYLCTYPSTVVTIIFDLFFFSVCFHTIVGKH